MSTRQDGPTVRGPIWVGAFALAAAFLADVASSAPQPPSNVHRRVEFAVEDLGLLAPLGFSVAEALNNLGAAVGTGVADSNYRAALFANATAVGLLPLGGEQSEAEGINDLGWIVGITDIAQIHPVYGGFLSRGFVWLPATPGGVPSGMYEIGTFGGDYSEAFDVNNSGQVVGSAATNGDGSLGFSHAYRWQSWNMTDLGTLGGPSSGARAINESGEVVGYSDVPNGDQHAFFWSEAGGMIDLGTFGGGFTIALDVNDAGLAVGYSETPEFTGFSGTLAVRRAFLWRDGLLISLGTLPIGPLPGGPYGPDHIHSTANGINKAGVIVGQSFPDQRAVLWRNGQIRDLNRLIRANSGWVLTNATGINDAGQIVGAGRLNGQLRAYRLTPVMPTTGGDVSLQP